MHNFAVKRRLCRLTAAGLCLAAIIPAGADALPTESALRPVEEPPSAVETLRPEVCPEDLTPLPVEEEPAAIEETDPSETEPEESDPETEEELPAPPDEAEIKQLRERAARRLWGRGLSQAQNEALYTLFASNVPLLEQLEQGELTNDDLVYLALPNGRAALLDRYSAWAGEHPKDTPETVVFQVNMGQDQDSVFYQDIKTVSNPGSLSVLVNKNNALPKTYVPKLEALGSVYGSGSMRPEAAKAFRSMADAARKDGISLRSVSAYRSYQRQDSTYNRYLQYDVQTSVDTYSARPGHSEHQTGLALDINTANLQAHFENTPAFAWLQKHCAEYGFMLRYREGKEEITGYRFEPWHYRYVGVEAAKVCMERGIVYEEYLALQRDA